MTGSNDATRTLRRTHRGRRSGVVLAAVLAALVVWGIAQLMLGIDVQAPAPAEDEVGFDIGAGAVILTSGVAGLAAWAVLALLERYTARARPVWITIALFALFASLGGPLSGTGVDPGVRATLGVLHLVVAAVLVPGLAQTARLRGSVRARP